MTLPLIAPGILAGGLLAFALSIDDFVITIFNAGTTVTFPLCVWGAARVGVPPQVNVIGTIIFVAAVGLDGREHRSASDGASGRDGTRLKGAA